MRTAVLAAATLLAACIGHAQAEPGGGVLVEGPGGSATVQLDGPGLSRASGSLAVEHETRQARFDGVLLWSVLGAAHGALPAEPRRQVRGTVTVTGSDGYAAVLALGEVSPEFEGKQVILADRMDGAALGPSHLRLVVPGDKRAGRSVRDVVRIVVAP